MKFTIAFAFVVFALAPMVHAADTAQNLQPLCNDRVSFHDDTTRRRLVQSLTLAQMTMVASNSAMCRGFVSGVMDTASVFGVWHDDVDSDQMVKVFLKYLDENPNELNRPGATVVIRSAQAAGLFMLKPEFVRMQK